METETFGITWIELDILIAQGDLRRLPGSKSCALRTKVGDSVGLKCTGCNEPFIDPEATMWFCDSVWLKIKEHGRWHDHCLEKLDYYFMEVKTHGN